MSLESYLNNRWIHRHESSVDEIRRLLSVADRDIQQSQTVGLGPEWRFDIAYNSALQSATAALTAAGFLAERQNKHMRTLECLKYTIGLSQPEVDLLDSCRRKRHLAVYEQVGAISNREADEMIALAQSLRTQVGSWICKEHPDVWPSELG
jgi:hypothetical protein